MLALTILKIITFMKENYRYKIFFADLLTTIFKSLSLIFTNGGVVVSDHLERCFFSLKNNTLHSCFRQARARSY
jgi:hypothetical protein